MIVNELRLRTESAALKIEYQVKDGYPPFHIVDDSQLIFYIEFKKKDPDFTKYPLCLTNEINDIQHASTKTLSDITNGQLYIEAVQSECVASNSLYEQGEVVADMVEDYIYYGEFVAGQIMDI